MAYWLLKGKKWAARFLVVYGQNRSRGFLPLLPSTQQKILKAFSRLCNDLAHALGKESLTYAEFIQLAREYYGPGKMPWSFAQSLAAAVYAPHITFNDVPNLDSLTDDQEKLEAALLSAPEPSPSDLETFLKLLNEALPSFRDWLSQETKKLPHRRGGAPRKLSSAEEQAKVVEEIKKLRGPGVKLDDVFKRVAQRHGVSPSKIKQVWRQAAAQSSETS